MFQYLLVVRFLQIPKMWLSKPPGNWCSFNQNISLYCFPLFCQAKVE